MWTSLIVVCDRYQVHLASLIADRALKPEVAKTLSDIADQLMEQKEPKEVLEIMLGGSAGKFFQSPMCLIGPWRFWFLLEKNRRTGRKTLGASNSRSNDKVQKTCYTTPEYRSLSHIGGTRALSLLPPKGL